MGTKNEAPWHTPVVEALRAGPGTRVAELDTNSTPGFDGDKALGERLLEERGAVLSDLQGKLFANGRGGDPRSVLLILQGMDTAGKGGIAGNKDGLAGNGQAENRTGFIKIGADQLL